MYGGDASVAQVPSGDLAVDHSGRAQSGYVWRSNGVDPGRYDYPIGSPRPAHAAGWDSKMSISKKIRFEIAPLKRLSVYIELQEDKKIEIRQIYRLHLKDEPAVEKLNDLEDLLFKSLQEDMDPDLQKTKKA